MANDKQHTHPLIRGGTSQQQRLLQALRASHAQVDERDTADLILFADKYAEHLQYINTENQADGNWRTFTQQDVSTSVASIADQSVKAWQSYVDQLVSILQNRDNSGNANLLKNHFKSIFDFLFTILHRLDQQYEVLPESLGLEEFIRIEITSKLRFSVERLIGYYKLAADDAGDVKLIDEGSDFVPSFAVGEIFLSQDFTQQGLGKLWYEGFSSWATYYESITANPTQSPFGENPAGLTTFEKVNNALTYNLFTSIVEGILRSLNRMIVAAADALTETLENWPDHTPDMGLYLAFLRLFKFAQDDLNTFTQRHLDFYYREVLGLKEKPATPDQVHVLFELAKHKETHLIEEDIALKAGKDSEGEDVSYVLKNELAANKAQISALQSVYVDEANEARIYAAPISNSADGEGADITKTSGSWDAFGRRANFPLAAGEQAVGFALASPYLFLSGGKRVIEVELKLKSLNGVSASDLNQAFIVSLTTEEGWYELTSRDELPVPVSVVINSTTKTATIICTVLSDAPAITAYDQELHGGAFGTAYPIINLKLKNESSQPYAYKKIRSWVVKNASITVDVEGLRDLIVQNDQGPVDPSKSFFPFGSQPVVNSGWVIGSKEVLKKEATELSLEVEWEGLPEDGISRHNGNTPGNTTEYTVDAYHLKQGRWEVISDDNRDLKIFDYAWAGMYVAGFVETLQAETIIGNLAAVRSIAPSMQVRSVNSIQAASMEYSLVEFDQPLVVNAATQAFLETDAFREIPGYFKELNAKSLVINSEEATVPEGEGVENETFSTKSTSGFIRLQLNSPDFGHKTFPIRYAKQAIIIARDINESANDLPNEPYTPTIRSLSLNYKATSSVALHASDEHVGQFFHIHPFGESVAPAYQAGQNHVHVLPQYKNEGEFYIGITGLTPPQNIAILFQLEEGSAFPLKEPQEVVWSYLSNNSWVVFEDRDISDATANLLNSGIITFGLPTEATHTPGLMPGETHWLRAHVKQDTDATNYFVGVHAQAALSEFKDQENASDFLETPLEAEIISKLLVKDAAIKKVSQPYSSFGGKTQETQTAFETRVSERLRHKNRSISIWDYEHMVLQAFPEIYKVKCLSHTRYETSPETAYHEVAPGHVCLVPVPNLINRNAYDPLSPYTSLGLLQEIEQFVKKYTSPFVKLHVKNPLLEKIQVAFNVQFLQGLDETIYSELLEEEIKRFLSPWAFEDGVDIEFGGKIHKSSIINFIEERTYVDFITQVKMHQFIEDLVDGELNIIEEKLDIETAIATTGRSILVSKAIHSITPSGVCV